jgi:hypothetical protein
VEPVEPDAAGGLPGFDSLVISSEQARAIEERIAGMRRNQPTGAADEGFDELQIVEPIGGNWHSSATCTRSCNRATSC